MLPVMVWAMRWARPGLLARVERPRQGAKALAPQVRGLDQVAVPVVQPGEPMRLAAVEAKEVQRALGLRLAARGAKLGARFLDLARSRLLVKAEDQAADPGTWKPCPGSSR